MRISPIIRWLLFGLVMLVLSAAGLAQLSVVIRIGPPALPVYEQPFCPGEGYLWVPGYWAYDYDDNDYYWVPGTWVLAPEPGLLWTPGYWAWESDRFFFHEGYWGPRVGFYGGIVYGFGYFGEGYEGGRWDHDRFFYNRAVNNVNVTEIHNVYNTTVINNVTVNRVSYNGGNGGIERRPTRQEEDAARERHIPPVSVQNQHIQEARADRQLHASVNQGRPDVAATPKPGAFHDRGVVRAREAGAPYRPAENRGGAQRDDRRVVHPKDLPPIERPTPNAGGSRTDQKYQRDQEKQFAKQEQERQKLQQQQERDHQRMDQKRADDARRQQTEQRHEQQTQQLRQKQERQQQKMQERQRPSDNRSKPSKEDRPPHGQA
jgi:hypothetical protein